MRDRPASMLLRIWFFVKTILPTVRWSGAMNERRGATRARHHPRTREGGVGSCPRSRCQTWPTGEPRRHRPARRSLRVERLSVREISRREKCSLSTVRRRLRVTRHANARHESSLVGQQRRCPVPTRPLRPLTPGSYRRILRLAENVAVALAGGPTSWRSPY
jgi:hypothetical protein